MARQVSALEEAQLQQNKDGAWNSDVAVRSAGHVLQPPGRPSWSETRLSCPWRGYLEQHWTHPGPRSPRASFTVAVDPIDHARSLPPGLRTSET